MTRIKRIARQLESLLGGTSERGSDGVLQNVLWLAFDRGWRLLVGFAVGIAVTRHLGPSGSGLLMSSMALAAMSSCLIELGFDALLRRELVQADPKRRGELLGTATAVRAAFLPVAIAVFATAFFLQPHGAVRSGLFLALVLTLPMPLFFVFDSWFQAQTRARYTVWVQNAVLLASVVVRLVLLANQADVTAFAWVAAGETMLIGALLIVVYCRTGESFTHWRYLVATARDLWRDAWPYAVINLAALGYSRLDMVMLGAIRGETEAGFYAAATRLTEITTILPMVLVTSLLPTLARVRANNRSEYRDRVQHLCTLVTWIAIGTAALVTLLAPWIVSLIYGPAFAPTAGILVISAWTGVFASQGAARGQWLLLENLQRFGLWYVTIGFIVNVILNLALIPPLGGAGAAIAAVLTQAVVALVAPAFFAPTRPGVRFLLNAFLFRRANGS